MTDLKKLPSWLVVTPDSATVTLSRPSEINSVVVDRLTLRSPTVREVRAANATAGGDDEAREMHLFASLLAQPGGRAGRLAGRRDPA